jgi:hypothetical protein
MRDVCVRVCVRVCVGGWWGGGGSRTLLISQEPTAVAQNEVRVHMFSDCASPQVDERVSRDMRLPEVGERQRQASAMRRTLTIQHVG